jgi:hypothetical protein
MPYEPREGEGVNFDGNITEEKVVSLKDAQGDIGYEKVFEFLLPDFGGKAYFECIAGGSGTE